MNKIDFKKKYKNLYQANKNKVSIIDVNSMNFLMIDGKGNPNTSKEFNNAIESLYPLSYTIKFMIKNQQNIDYVVMPLEGLWWVNDMTQFSVENKDIWEWTLMIMQPTYVTKKIFEKAYEKVMNKKNPVALSKVRFESFNEGLSAQIMHIGPYSEEEVTIKKLHDFIKEKNYALRSKHHEIYLSDPRKTNSGKIKTIIRQPITDRNIL